MAGNAFCRACGAEILDETEICPKCGVRQKPAQVKNPGLAAVASFFLGWIRSNIQWTNRKRAIIYGY